MKTAQAAIVMMFACLLCGSVLLAQNDKARFSSRAPQSAVSAPAAADPQEKPGRVAVTAVAPSLDADVDPRFGRCRYFIIVETKGDKFEVVENADPEPGQAGKQAVQLIAAKGVRVLLTGQCGPGASAALAAAGIRVVPGCSGTVRSAIAKFRSGQ